MHAIFVRLQQVCGPAFAPLPNLPQHHWYGRMPVGKTTLW